MRFINLGQHRAALRASRNHKQSKKQALEFQASRQRSPPGRHTTPKTKRAQPRRALFQKLTTNNLKPFTPPPHPTPRFPTATSPTPLPLPANPPLPTPPPTDP